MQISIALSILALAASGLAQQSNLSNFSILDGEIYQQNYSFLVSLKIHLKEETLPKLFTEFAMKNIPCTFEGCDINLLNISEALNISRYSTEVLAEALAKINISDDNVFKVISEYQVTLGLVVEILQKFNMTPYDIYFKFGETFPEPYKTIEDIATAFNINASDLIDQINGDDFTKLQTLLPKNYSADAVALINKIEVDLLKLLPLSAMASKLNVIDGDEFTKLVKTLGITSDSLVEFYQHLNITPLMFLSYPPFVHTVTAIYETLNPEEVLALLVSNNTLYTSKTAKMLEAIKTESHLIKTYTNFYVESVENPHIHSTIEHVTLQNHSFVNNDLATLKLGTPVTAKAIEISTNYTSSSWVNCSYITKMPLGGVHVEYLEPSRISYADKHIFVVKSNATVYNLGSPLLCQNKLVGISSGQDAKQIRLSTLETMPATASPSATAGCGNFMSLVLIITVLLQNFWI